MTDISHTEVEKFAKGLDRGAFKLTGHPNAKSSEARLLRALRAELDRSEARVATLEGALRPFSDACQYVHDDDADDYAPAWAEFFEVGQFRRARAAQQAKGE